MITVRRVGSGDAVLLRDVALRSLTDSPAAFGRTLEQEQSNSLSYYEDRAAVFGSSDQTTTFLLFVDEEVAGVIGAFFDRGDPPNAYVCAMWVDPRHRRHGAGMKLVTVAIAWLCTRGAQVVHAWVADRNAAGRAFWNAAGFRPSSTTQPHPTDPRDSETLYVWKPEPAK
jgi:GNAT superfamily N-acetyltransferase